MTITFNDRRRPAAAGLSLAGNAGMSTEDTVLVKATTTYMEGHEHKNERSAPYRVPRAHAVDLTANGFAVLIDEPLAAQEAGAADDGRADPVTEGKIENDGKPRGRRGVARD